MELLDREIILRSVDNRHQDTIELILHSELDSTNTYLLNQPTTDKIEVCLAETQTNGRGRHGNQWHSPSGANIYLSFAHKLQMQQSVLSGLSLVIGLTLTEVLQKYCRKLIQVKWPNDLLVETKKLCGILIEIKSLENGYCKVVTGIGINVEMPLSDTDGIDQPYTCLQHCEPIKPYVRNELTADIVNHILRTVELFEESGFQHFHHRWNEHDAWFEKSVVLQVGNKIVKGIHRGVDEFGSIVLDVDGKLSSWSSGQVSLRRAG